MQKADAVMVGFYCFGEVSVKRISFIEPHELKPDELPCSVAMEDFSSLDSLAHAAPFEGAYYAYVPLPFGRCHTWSRASGWTFDRPAPSY
jgi:hypothetical protein